MVEIAKSSPAGGAQIGRVHHIAYAVKDQAATRRFYEDVLGLPLVAAWAEIAEFPEFPGRQIEYLHTFYSLDDGSTIAFFAFADDDVYEVYKRAPSPFIHYSMKVEAAHRKTIEERVIAGGYPSFAIDHGYVDSFYVVDPDGLVVEFCIDPQNVEQINARQLVSAHATLERWVAGDRTPNNDPREFQTAQ